MGKTYDAMKKAESDKSTGSTRVDDIPVDGRSLPVIDWRMEEPTRLEFQKIRVWLNNLVSRGQSAQTVMVVACRSGSGGTTVAASLAAILAEGRKSRTLIVDGNFRTPSLNRVFDLRNNGGLTEVLFDGVSFDVHAQLTHRNNLFLLTTGRLSSSSIEAFEGQPLDEFIAQLKQKFAFIVFDSAPVLDFPDACALAPRVDAILLVVEADKTSVEEARRAKQALEKAGGRIVGIVLNRQRDYTPARLRRFFKHER